MRFVWLVILLFCFTFCSMSQFASAEANPLAQAMDAHVNGRVDDALRLYIKALKDLSGPSASKVMSNVGALYMGKGNYQLASRFFEKAADTDEDNTMARFNLAVVQTSKLEQHEAAYASCLRVIKADPAHVKGLHLMGNILQSMGRSSAAEEYFMLADQKAQLAQTTAGAGTVGAEEAHRRRELNAYIYNNTLLSMAVNETREFPQYPLPGPEGSGEEGVQLLSVTCLSRRPFVFYLRNVLTAAECTRIIAQARPLMQPSFVTGAGEGVNNAHTHAGGDNVEGEVEDISGFYRSSHTAWLPLDAALQAMQGRLAAAMSIPASFIQLRSEELQVVSYTRDGAQFRLHQDSSRFLVRHCTALFYLNNPNPNPGEGGDEVGGGETWFPYANSSADSVPGSGSSSNEALMAAIERGLAMHADTKSGSDPLPGVLVPPRMGDAVLFFNHAPPVEEQGSAEVTATGSQAASSSADPDLGSMDVAAVHAGLPVTGSAHKWIANYWF